MPSMPGMRRSVTRMSGADSCTRASAVAPSSARTTSNPSSRSRVPRPLRALASSSATTTRGRALLVFGFVLHGPSSRRICAHRAHCAPRPFSTIVEFARHFRHRRELLEHGLGRLRGQAHGEDRGPGPARERDVTAVVGHDALDDGEAEAGPSVLGRVEGVEDGRVRVGNARRRRRRRRSPTCSGSRRTRTATCPAFLDGVERVAHEVHEHLLGALDVDPAVTTGNGKGSTASDDPARVGLGRQQDARPPCASSLRSHSAQHQRLGARRPRGSRVTRPPRRRISARSTSAASRMGAGASGDPREAALDDREVQARAVERVADLVRQPRGQRAGRRQTLVVTGAPLELALLGHVDADDDDVGAWAVGRRCAAACQRTVRVLPERVRASASSSTGSPWVAAIRDARTAARPGAEEQLEDVQVRHLVPRVARELFGLRVRDDDATRLRRGRAGPRPRPAERPRAGACARRAASEWPRARWRARARRGRRRSSL